MGAACPTGGGDGGEALEASRAIGRVSGLPVPKDRAAQPYTVPGCKGATSRWLSWSPEMFCPSSCRPLPGPHTRQAAPERDLASPGTCLRGEIVSGPQKCLAYS